MPFVKRDLEESADAWVLRDFFGRFMKYIAFWFFALQILADTWREKAGIVMMIIVLNKVADCSLPFAIIFGKYLALASVRSFQYWDSWDFYIMLCVHSPNAHRCSSSQNPSAIQGPKFSYILRRLPEHESAFPFLGWGTMTATLEKVVIQACMSSLLLLMHLFLVCFPE